MKEVTSPQLRSVDCTFLGGGGGFCWKANLTASAAVSGSLRMLFLESASDNTTKKWWHFSHFTKRVEAEKAKDSESAWQELVFQSDKLSSRFEIRRLQNELTGPFTIRVGSVGRRGE